MGIARIRARLRLLVLAGIWLRAYSQNMCTNTLELQVSSQRRESSRSTTLEGRFLAIANQSFREESLPSNTLVVIRISRSTRMMIIKRNMVYGAFRRCTFPRDPRGSTWLRLRLTRALAAAPGMMEQPGATRQPPGAHQLRGTRSCAIPEASGNMPR